MDVRMFPWRGNDPYNNITKTKMFRTRFDGERSLTRWRWQNWTWELSALKEKTNFRDVESRQIRLSQNTIRKWFGNRRESHISSESTRFTPLLREIDLLGLRCLTLRECTWPYGRDGYVVATFILMIWYIMRSIGPERERERGERRGGGGRKHSFMIFWSENMVSISELDCEVVMVYVDVGYDDKL